MIWFFPFLIPYPLYLCPTFSLYPLSTSRLHCWSCQGLERMIGQSPYTKGEMGGKKKHRQPRSNQKQNTITMRKTNYRALSCLVLYESKRIYYMASAMHLKRAHSWVMHVLVENITRSPVSLFAPTEPFFQAFLCAVCAIYAIYGTPQVAPASFHYHTFRETVYVSFVDIIFLQFM